MTVIVVIGVMIVIVVMGVMTEIDVMDIMTETCVTDVVTVHIRPHLSSLYTAIMTFSSHPVRFFLLGY